MEFGCTIAVAALPQEQPQAINLRDADRWNTVFQSGRESTAGVRVNHKSVIGYPAFWRGVNLIADGVSGLPVDVYERDGDGRAVANEHPAQKLLKLDSSSVQAAQTFQQTMQGHALIFGNAFAWIERDARMRPFAMWIMDPQQMAVRYVDGELWYCTVIDGEQRKFPGRDVLHLKGLGHDGICGYSALDIFNEALGLGIAAQQFGSRFFGQGANMGGLLMVPGHFDEQKIRNTMAAWSEMSEGMKNSHKVALLQDGVKFIQTGIDPEKGQFNETRAFEVAQVVASILGVPTNLLGDPNPTSHNSLESQAQSFLQHSLGPWLDKWEAELSRKLLSSEERQSWQFFIEFNRKAAIRMEFEKQINAVYRQVEMGMLTINEARKLHNIPDVGEDGDKRYHPANWTVVGEEPEPMTAQPPAAAEPDDDDDSTEDTLRAILHSNVTDALRLEKRRMMDAAKKPDTFMAAIEAYYSVWTKCNITGITSSEGVAAKQNYVDESKRQLSAAAAASMPAALAGTVAETVATWDDRAITLTSDLMRTIK